MLIQCILSFHIEKKREKPSTSKFIGQLLYHLYTLHFLSHVLYLKIAIFKGVTTCASSNHLKDQTDDSIYSDIRECYLIGSSSVSSTCNLSTCFSKDYKHLQEIVERSSKQDMLTPTASRVLGLKEYESCFKESEVYSRL